MAQTLSVAAQKNPFMDGTGPFTLVIDWQSDSSGNVSKKIASTYTTAQALLSSCPPAPVKVQGILMTVETIPGLYGDKATTCPSQYGLTILDAYGLDILAGGGATRSASVAEKYIVSGTHLEIDSELTVTIASAGDTKTGRIIMEFKELGYVKVN